MKPNRRLTVAALAAIVMIVTGPAGRNSADGEAKTATAPALTVGAGGVLLRNGKPYRAFGVNYFNAFLRTLVDHKDTSYRRGFAELAKRDIPQGTMIQKNDLAKAKAYERDVSVRGHVVLAEDAKLILGRRTMFQIDRGEAIFWSDIEGARRSGLGLASRIQPGLRAISLAVGGAAAVSGMVEPNDHVDVLGTFSFPSKSLPDEMETVTLTVLQDVTVLATGTRMAGKLPVAGLTQTSHCPV